jgi:3D (Asp-Asp-Asp) domain-containing protein
MLSENGIHPTVGDKLSPAPDSLLLQPGPIIIEKISAYMVFFDNQPVPVYSADRIPANILRQLGVELFPMDEVFLDGQQIDPQVAVSWRPSHALRVIRSFPAQIKLEDGSVRQVSLRSTDPNEALWQVGLGGTGAILIPEAGPSDSSQPIFQVMNPLAKSEGSYSQSPKKSVNLGSTLALSGLAPQGLDILQQEDSPVVGLLPPPNIARVAEHLQIVQKSIPFSSRVEMDDTLELDQSKTTQMGAYGVSMQLTRIRTQDGQKVSEKVESETVIQAPEDQITGYGTKVNVKTVNVGGTTIEYYRSVTMFASSYSPCNLGNNTCNSTTASGAPAGKGIVAVVRRWYNYMVGARLYIEGYGFATIGDIGGGIPGEYWIDLGYSDADYVPWHSYVKVYFLTPVPENILYNLD